MKVIVDENLPPALARALHALFAGEHEIIHLRDKFGSGVSDLKWITDLSNEGRWVVLSGDRRITRNKAEYHAFRSSKLIGLFLSAGLHKAKLIKKTERILALWQKILDMSNTVEGGAMFELPMKSNRLKQMNP